MSSSRFQSAQRNLAYASHADQANFANYVNQATAARFAANQANRTPDRPSYDTGATSSSGPGPESSGGARANDSMATVLDAFSSVLGGRPGKPPTMTRVRTQGGLSTGLGTSSYFSGRGGR